MYRKMIPSSKFERAYKKFVRSRPFLQSSIDSTLVSLENDAFSINLGSHKLSGDLYGLMACSCGYDCRIIF